MCFLLFFTFEDSVKLTGAGQFIDSTVAGKIS